MVEKLKKYWWIGAIVVVVIVVIFLASCGGGGAASPSYDCPAGRTKTTAKGVCLPALWQPDSQIDRADGGWVITETAVTDPAIRKLIAERVQSGLTRMIAAALHRNPTWTNYTASGQFQVLMIRKMATNMDGTPALKVREIQTAGTVINIYADRTEHGEPIIVLPMTDDWLAANYAPYLEASAYHEGEHSIEWKNDKGIFFALAGAGDVHPHWPPLDALRGLVAQRPPACEIEAGADPNVVTKLK